MGLFFKIHRIYSKTDKKQNPFKSIAENSSIAVLTGFGLNIFELFSAAFACSGSSFGMDEFFNLSQPLSNFRISRPRIKGTFFFKNGFWFKSTLRALEG